MIYFIRVLKLINLIILYPIALVLCIFGIVTYPLVLAFEYVKDGEAILEDIDASPWYMKLAEKIVRL